jgi:hypothetical protein
MEDNTQTPQKKPSLWDRWKEKSGMSAWYEGKNPVSHLAPTVADIRRARRRNRAILATFIGLSAVYFIWRFL